MLRTITFLCVLLIPLSAATREVCMTVPVSKEARLQELCDWVRNKLDPVPTWTPDECVWEMAKRQIKLVDRRERLEALSTQIESDASDFDSGL